MAEQRFTPREAETDTVYPESPRGEPVANPPGRPAFKDETERLANTEQPNMEPDRSMPRVSFGPESDAPSSGPSGTLPGEKRAEGDAT